MNILDLEKIVQIITDAICEAIKDIDNVEIDQILDQERIIQIDSVVGVHLVFILEKKLGIMLPDGFLSSENCSSLNKIVHTYLDMLERSGINVR